MQFAHTERTRHPRALVYRTHRDEIVAITSHLEAVKSVELRKRTVHAGGRLELTHRWQGTRAALPPLVRAMIPEELLVWSQRTTWDNHGWVADWVIEVHALGPALACSGRNAYFEEPDGGCRIEVTGDFAFRPDQVPQLAGVPAAAVPVVERAVVAMIVPLIKQSGAAVASYLDAHG